MKYRVTFTMEVDAISDRQAHDYALKLEGLLKSPLVRMAVEGEGVRLSGDGRPVVYKPERDIA